MGLSGEVVQILKPLDCLRLELQSLFDKGIRTIAVCPLHSWTCPVHERRVAQVAKSIDFTRISLSFELSPAMKVIPRGNAAAIHVYLSPSHSSLRAKFPRQLHG